jgi:hypothetical protein
MKMAKTNRGRAALKALPKRLERVQAEAEKAVTRGVKATLELLPPGTRKTVRELGEQLEDAASELRTRGRKVVRVMEKRGGALAGRVEHRVAQLEKRGAKVLKTAEREGSRFLDALEVGATRVVRRLTSTLDIASASDVERLGKRLAVLERKLTGRAARSHAA